jgi:hypothetical protein
MDITIGHNSTTPSDLLEAAGRRLAPDEKLRCIGCHSTGAVRKRELLLNELTPGVQCSHCHEKRFYSFNREIDARVSHFQRRQRLNPLLRTNRCWRCLRNAGIGLACHRLVKRQSDSHIALTAVGAFFAPC